VFASEVTKRVGWVRIQDTWTQGFVYGLIW